MDLPKAEFSKTIGAGFGGEVDPRRDAKEIVSNAMRSLMGGINFD